MPGHLFTEGGPCKDDGAVHRAWREPKTAHMKPDPWIAGTSKESRETAWDVLECRSVHSVWCLPPVILIQKVEARELVQWHPWLHVEFKATLGYMRSCSKKTKTETARWLTWQPEFDAPKPHQGGRRVDFTKVSRGSHMYLVSLSLFSVSVSRSNTYVYIILKIRNKTNKNVCELDTCLAQDSWHLLGFLSWAQPHQPIFGDLFVPVSFNHFPILLLSSYSRHISALLQEGDWCRIPVCSLG